MATEKDKVIEAEIVEDDGSIKMVEEPEKVPWYKKLGRGLKSHWKGILIGVASTGAAGAGGAYLGYRKGKASANKAYNDTTTDSTNYIEEGGYEQNPEN